MHWMSAGKLGPSQQAGSCVIVIAAACLTTPTHCMVCLQARPHGAGLGSCHDLLSLDSVKASTGMVAGHQHQLVLNAFLTVDRWARRQWRRFPSFLLLSGDRRTPSRFCCNQVQMHLPNLPYSPDLEVDLHLFQCKTGAVQYINLRNRTAGSLLCMSTGRH